MFKMVGDPFFEDIRIKVCQMFDIPKNTLQCRYVVESNLRSWFENKLNFKIETL